MVRALSAPCSECGNCSDAHARTRSNNWDLFVLQVRELTHAHVSVDTGAKCCKKRHRGDLELQGKIASVVAGALDPVPTHLLCCPCPGDPTGWLMRWCGLVARCFSDCHISRMSSHPAPLRHSLLGSEHCLADCLWPLGTEAQGKGELGLFPGS